MLRSKLIKHQWAAREINRPWGSLMAALSDQELQSQSHHLLGGISHALHLYLQTWRNGRAILRIGTGIFLHVNPEDCSRFEDQKRAEVLKVLGWRGDGF